MKRPRYNSLNHYLRERFGGRVAKISLDAGFDCPNRDGTISSSGCVFCNARGSGTGFHGQSISVKDQVERAIPWLTKRYRTDKFIAYFQAYTNTYKPTDELRAIYSQALAFPQVKAMAVGTRPDCVGEAKLDLLAGINREKEVWLEMGVQSAHDKTLQGINRGHDFKTFRSAAIKAVDRELMVFAHLILGLPGEGFEEAATTVSRLAGLGLAGVKLHGLYVDRNAPLADLYNKGKVRLLTREEYVNLVCDLIPLMPSKWIIQRIVSDPARWTLVAPQWMLKKEQIIQEIHDRLEHQDLRQGEGLATDRSAFFPSARGLTTK